MSCNFKNFGRGLLGVGAALISLCPARAIVWGYCPKGIVLCLKEGGDVEIVPYDRKLDVLHAQCNDAEPGEGATLEEAKNACEGRFLMNFDNFDAVEKQMTPQVIQILIDNEIDVEEVKENLKDNKTFFMRK